MDHMPAGAQLRFPIYGALDIVVQALIVLMLTNGNWPTAGGMEVKLCTVLSIADAVVGGS